MSNKTEQLKKAKVKEVLQLSFINGELLLLSNALINKGYLIIFSADGTFAFN